MKNAIFLTDDFHIVNVVMKRTMYKLMIQITAVKLKSPNIYFGIYKIEFLTTPLNGGQRKSHRQLI